MKSFIVLLYFVNIQLLCMNEQFSLVVFSIDDIFSLIQKNLSLQEMSRLYRTCTICQKKIDIENFCRCSDIRCQNKACVFLKYHYDIGTKVLAHYDKTNNRTMFEHIFMQNRRTRLAELEVFNFSKPYKYSKYNTMKKIEKKRLKQLKRTLGYEYDQTVALPLLKKILRGSRFNIFDSGKSYRIRHYMLGSDKYSLSYIFYCVLNKNDADLLLAILGGSIEPRAFKYVIPCASLKLLYELLERNVFIPNVSDKRGRDFSFYMEKRITTRLAL